MSMKKDTRKQLTEEEANILLEKGTEAPFSGVYNNHFEKGLYLCKQCDTPLYSSIDKFESQCGWPSFDNEILNAVRRVSDPDGRRTEIVCNACGGHLGHVFLGEQLTKKNTRHCVNSLSLTFISISKLFEQAYHDDENIGALILSAGCFWGVEYHFSQLNGVLATDVGYAGGETDHPSYKAVCTGKTGHAESIRIIYDKKILDDRTLLKLFFEIHNPEQVDRQGPDIGSQYRSAIFYLNQTQKDIAKELIGILERKGLSVATQILAYNQYWPAEKYHQDYYKKNGQMPYCHTYQKRF